MNDSELLNKIKETKALLLAGSNADDVLTNFAAWVESNAGGGACCPGCGSEDEPCFRCKAREVLGDQAAMALPFLLPKLAELVREWGAGWLDKRKQKSAAKAAGFAPGKEGF